MTDIITPRAVQIDASSHCQLKCPTCPTADGRTRAVLGLGHLKLADFEEMLDRNPGIQTVELSNYGEMFLNPQLPKILEAAYRRNVVVSGNNGVNLNFASEEALEAVVRYRVRGLTCSLDGATPETYAKYRLHGNLENVLKNIDRITEHKRRLRTGFPMLYWQFVVFGHNEHELEMAKSMAAERGMDFVPRLSWDPSYSPVKNPALVTIETGLGAATRDGYKQEKGYDYTRDICYQLWNAPVVNWDGKLLGCCVNFWGDFGGNVFSEGLLKATANDKMTQARAMLKGEQAPVAGIPCTNCEQFFSLRDSGRWLSEREIALKNSQTYITSILPTGAPGARFAKIAVFAEECSCGGHPLRAKIAEKDTTGRIFRFGVDHALFCKAPGPGDYVVVADQLTPKGWARSISRFAAPERPICNELELDFSAGCESDATSDLKVGQPLPTWIQ